jgi:hypothetical protein
MAIGGAIAWSACRSDVPAMAVRNVVDSHAVLRAMKSGFAWFVPMLEVPMLEVLVTQNVAESRRSSVMRRLSSLAKRTSVAPIGGQSDDGEDDAESGFSSVVRCPRHELLAASHISLCALVNVAWTTARFTGLPQVPSETRAIEAAGTTLDETTEPEDPICVQSHSEVLGLWVLLCPFALTCLCKRRFPPERAAAPAIFFRQRRQAHASPHRSPGRMRQVPRASTKRSSLPRRRRL